MDELSIISNLLRQLLNSHNRVSLPGMGAFVVNHTPASFTRGGRGMLPPGTQIAFLSTETWNDELLEQLFAKQIGISHNEAKHQLQLFANKTSHLLQLGKRIEFPGFGILRMTADNELRFTAEDPQQFSPDSFGLLEIEMSPAVPEPPVNTANTPVNTAQPPAKRRCSVVCWVLIALLLLMGGIILFRRPLVQWIEEMNYSTEELAYLRRPQTPAVETLPTLPATPPVTPPAAKEATVPDPKPIAVQAAPEPAVKTERTPGTTGKTKPMNRYHIIVAGFEQEAEATQLAKKVTDTEGYICLVIHTGGNRPYKVSILRYNSQQEADVILNGIKKTDSTDFHNAWVEKY